MRKENLIMILLICIFSIIGLMFFGLSNDNIKNVEIALEDLIERQALMDQEINDYIESKKYTIDNPKIIINPYEISPLTSLIIFSTKENTSINVYLNEELLFRIKNAKEFSIPIIGLIANKDNIIKLDDGKQEYKYKIKPKVDAEVNNLKISLKSDKFKSYMISSSTTLLAYSSINGLGEMNYHLMLASQGELEFLNDDTFIVPAEEYITENNISTYTSLYIVDYLGKILKRIELEYGYHHDLKLLTNNELLVLGSKSEHPLSICYKVDLETGKTIDYIDFYEILKNVDPTWDNVDKKLKWGYGINSIDYNEATDDLLVSFRNLNLVMSINYKTKKINWMYTNEECFKNFSEYLLTSIDNKYVYGQHQVEFLNDSTISLYNNNYDGLNENKKVLKNQEAAEALILRINNNLKTISVIKSLKEENKNSYALGGFKTYEDSNAVVYSYLFKDDAINKNVPIYEYKDNTYSRIVEYNNFGNKIFEATIEDRIYRVNIHDLKINNSKYIPNSFKYINNNIYEIDEKLLENANKGDDIIKIYKNYYEISLDDNLIDEFVLFLRGKKKYNIPYVNTKTYYDIDKGIYDIYYKLNGKYYYLDKQIKF